MNNKKILKPVYYTLLYLSAIVALGSVYVLVNTYVSLKYETSMNSCISDVTSQNLCDAISRLKILTAISAATFLTLVAFKNKF